MNVLTCSPSQVLSGGRLLALNSAQVSDTGRYTCVAVNAGGEQHRDYDLKVYGEYWSTGQLNGQNMCM